MSRGIRRRCFAVWVGATSALVAMTGWVGGDALAVTDAATWRSGFESALVATCALAGLVCGAWCWSVTTLTTLEVLHDRLPGDAATSAGTTRRLVLALCGVAVTAQLAGPAAAADPVADGVRGLSLPDRAVARSARATRPARPARAAIVSSTVVRAGDSLWSLAQASLSPDATPARTTERWRAIYAANRAEIGVDPDLIHPGQRLQVPPLPHDPPPHRQDTPTHPEEQR